MGLGAIRYEMKICHYEMDLIPFRKMGVYLICIL
jgi:hypothetical protein